MKKTRILAGLSILLIAVVVYSLLKQPHQFDRSECPSCHVTDLSGRVYERKLTAPVAALCRKCHEKIFNEGYMHPYNVRPRQVVVPADMPLDQSDMVTCSTCHDVHSPLFTPYGASTHFLRRYDVGPRFCEACHPKSRSLSGGHKGMLGEAHAQVGSKYTILSSTQEIDSVSKNCITCHDGSFASSVSIGSGMWFHSSSPTKNNMGEHPIGVDYESARLRRRNAFLKPMDLVDKRIQFFNGRTGCGSCHNPYSNIDKMLVMADEGSRLCLCCHEMDRRQTR